MSGLLTVGETVRRWRRRASFVLFVCVGPSGRPYWGIFRRGYGVKRLAGFLLPAGWGAKLVRGAFVYVVLWGLVVCFLGVSFVFGVDWVCWLFGGLLFPPLTSSYLLFPDVHVPALVVLPWIGWHHHLCVGPDVAVAAVTVP